MKVTDVKVTIFNGKQQPWNTGMGGGTGTTFGDNSLNNVANLHVTIAIPNCDYYEVFPCTGANKYGLVNYIEVDEKGQSRRPTDRDSVT